jgi:hypothetical protein
MSFAQGLIFATQIITILGAVWKVSALLNDIRTEVRVLNAHVSNLKERVDRHELKSGD